MIPTVRHTILAALLLAGCGSQQSEPEPGTLNPQPSGVAEEPLVEEATMSDDSAADGVAGEPEDSESADDVQNDVVAVAYPGPEAVYATPPEGYEPPVVSLAVVKSDRNDITDIDRWWTEHPPDRITEIPIGAPETVEGEQFRYATGLDLAVVTYGQGHDQRYLWAEHADAPPTVIDLAALKVRWLALTYADRRGDTIFLAHSTRSSAEAMNGQNGYITAVDAWTGEVLWQSEPLVANSLNFEIINGVLISGYGFTAEEDFLYALDTMTGRVLTRMPVRKMAEYLAYDGETLFVRTYDRDLEVEVEIERP